MTLVNQNAGAGVLVNAMNTQSSMMAAKRTNNSYFKMMKNQLKAHGRIPGGDQEPIKNPSSLDKSANQVAASYQMLEQFSDDI